jgi:hypothetical protein
MTYNNHFNQPKVKQAVVGLVSFVPFRHFKQTPMQVVRHIKLIAHENHQ